MSNKTVFVKNKSGTTERKLPARYSSWLDYWEIKKEYGFPKCGNNACDNLDNLQGAHVYIVGSTSKEYIIPLCSACNSPHNKEQMEVFEQFLIVANQQ